jgi:2-methylcitrate dehydratase PrpD
MQHEAIQFIRDFRLGDAPPQAIHQVKRCLLDLIGVAAAGSQLDASRITRAVAVSQFGGDGGGLLFDGRKTSIAGSALANAMTIDAFDAHDGHPLTKGHAGCGSLAALLAFAGDGVSLSEYPSMRQHPTITPRAPGCASLPPGSARGCSDSTTLRRARR